MSFLLPIKQQLHEVVNHRKIVLLILFARFLVQSRYLAYFACIHLSFIPCGISYVALWSTDNYADERNGQVVRMRNGTHVSQWRPIETLPSTMAPPLRLLSIKLRMQRPFCLSCVAQTPSQMCKDDIVHTIDRMCGHVWIKGNAGYDLRQILPRANVVWTVTESLQHCRRLLSTLKYQLHFVVSTTAFGSELLSFSETP